MPFHNPVHPAAAHDNSNLPAAPNRPRWYPTEAAAEHILARYLRLLQRACSATSPPRTHSVPCSSWAVYIPTDFDVWRSIVRAVRSSLLAACEEASINAACVASTLLKHGAPTARWRRSACGSACGRRSRSKGLGAWCFDGKSVVRGGVSNHVAQERLRYAAQSPHSQVASAPRRLTLFPFSELDRGLVHLRTLGVRHGLRDREQSIEVAWCT